MLQKHPKREVLRSVICSLRSANEEDALDALCVIIDEAAAEGFEAGAATAISGFEKSMARFVTAARKANELTRAKVPA